MNSQDSENSALSRTGDQHSGLSVRREETSSQAEKKETFLDSLPPDLRKSFQEILFILDRSGGSSPFFGLSFNLAMLRLKVTAQVRDAWQQTEALQVVALIEPFVTLFDAEHRLQSLNKAIAEKSRIDPSESLLQISQCLEQVREALASTRPYSDEGRKVLQNRTQALQDSAEKIRVKAYMNFLITSYDRLVSAIKSHGDIIRGLEKLLEALESLSKNGIELTGDNPGKVEKLLRRGHDILLQQADSIKTRTDQLFTAKKRLD